MIPETVGGFFNALRNVYEFFRRYAGSALPTERGTPTLADRWILSRLQATVATVEAAWSAYDVTTGTRAIFDFVTDDLANWYVRTNRGRFWAVDAEADPAAVHALHETLVTVSRLLAPAAPFASDWLHRALSGRPVHVARFPEAGARDEGLEGAMDAVRRLASLARAAREERNLRVRQPLARMAIAVPAAVRGAEFDALLPLLASEVNVRSLEVVSSDTDLVRLVARPNFRALGKRFGKRTPGVADVVARLEPDALRQLEAGTPVEVTIDGERAEILPGDLTVERQVTSDWLVASDGPFVAALDPALDDALRAEGLAREIVNRVQRVRREAGYEHTTRIALRIDGAEPVRAAAGAHIGFIQEETLARSVEIGAQNGAMDREEEFSLDGLALVVGVRRFQAT
jgi:isoleucyl-tRNA synthetase